MPSAIISASFFVLSPVLIVSIVYFEKKKVFNESMYIVAFFRPTVKLLVSILIKNSGSTCIIASMVMAS